MNTKFTRGPWRVGIEWGHINPRIEILKDVSYVEGVEPTTYHIGDVGFPTSGPNTVGAIERKANAHLIAAAPEMYEATEAALECLENNGFARAYVEDILRGALRKARGEA